MKKVLFFASVALVAFSSCKKDNDEKKKDKVYKSEVQNFAHGKSWTWYEEDGNNNPLRLAIAIDDAAMASLSNTGHSGDDHQHNLAVSLKLHPKATAATPFQHVLLDWAAAGHPPFYFQPHFDLHYYMTSEAERLAIPPYEQDSLKFKNYPGPGYMPANYIPIPGGVPQMGTHWADVTSPEVGGVPFTQTFIYGTHDSKVTFYEPMITKKFIDENPGFQRAIPQPSKYQIAGWHPQTMRIEKKDGVTSIILENFERKQAQ